MQRTLILAAHPDDEVVGLGSQLAQFEDLHTAHVTDGAPANMRDAASHGFRTRTEYAEARRRELHSALRLAGIAPQQCFTLGIADQEASCQMAAIARRLRDVFERLEPALVYTHPYEGGHPDHDAVAFAARCACKLMGDGAPALVEFTSYHARNSAIEVYEFLPHPGCEPVVIELSPAATAIKDRMLDAFATQRETLRPFYGCKAEKWRFAPEYDFTAPPHAGTLYYDMFDWGIRSVQWRDLAAQALRELDLS
ncbi:MAG: PIG-L deacetylase family protein [bacterium]|jgi:LmbE family N-acetylglucosaminyl deacetylase